MMDKWIDLGMTKLFQFAEYVYSRCSLSSSEPTASQNEVVSTIRFTKEDKTAIKQVECDACSSSFKREPHRPHVKVVEGDLFK